MIQFLYDQYMRPLFGYELVLIIIFNLERTESLSVHYGSDKTGLCPRNLI